MIRALAAPAAFFLLASCQAPRVLVHAGFIDGALGGAFALSRAGGRTVVRNVDPDSPPAADLRTLWRARRSAPVAGVK